MTWSAGCVLPRYGSLCRKASPSISSGWRSVIASARNSMPITCTGRPSADASRRLSPVISAQEKSRAMFRTAERPVRRSVFSISRTIESSRFAITASVTGSKELIARAPLRQRRALGPLRRELEQVVPVLRDEGARPWVDDDRRRRLAQNRGPLDPGSGKESRPSWRGTVASPVSLKYASPSTSASRRSAGSSRGRSAGLSSTAVARTFQSRHSRYCPGSRTAKMRSCVAWKRLLDRTDVLVRFEPARHRHVELPHLGAVPGLDEEVLALRRHR